MSLFWDLLKCYLNSHKRHSYNTQGNHFKYLELQVIQAVKSVIGSSNACERALNQILS